MNVNDWITIAGYIIWIITVAAGVYVSNRFFENKKLDSKAQILSMLVKNAVSFYENSELNDDDKKNRVITDVANSLRNKGFNVSEQTIKDITYAVEGAVKSLEKPVDNSKKGDSKNA